MSDPELQARAAELANEVAELRKENEQLRAGKLPGGKRITIVCPFCPQHKARALAAEAQLAERERQLGAMHRAFVKALEHLPPCLCNARFSIRGKCQGDCVIAAMKNVVGLVDEFHRCPKSASENHHEALARRKQMMALASCTKAR